MQGLLGSDLLRMPVRLNGIELGRPVDLLLEQDGRRLVGIELLCGDQARRFLPLAAARLAGDELVVGSAFTFIEDAGFYRERGRTLAGLRGVLVERRREVMGTLADVVIGAHGSIDELVLDDGDRLPFDGETMLGAPAAGRTRV